MMITTTVDMRLIVPMMMLLMITTMITATDDLRLIVLMMILLMIMTMRSREDVKLT